MNAQSYDDKIPSISFDNLDVGPEPDKVPKLPQQISLTNFNPFVRQKYFLDSPRSIEACKRQGIAQNELLVKTLDDFEDIEIPLQFTSHKKEFLNIKLEFYERQRQKKLELCLQARKKLVESDTRDNSKERSTDQSNSFQIHVKSVSPRPSTGAQYSSLSAEKDKIDILKKKQDAHIELLISSERKKQKKQTDVFQKTLKIEELQAQRGASERDRSEQRRQEILQWRIKGLNESLRRQKAHDSMNEKEERSHSKQKVRRDRKERQKDEEAKWRKMKNNYKDEKMTVRLEQNEQEQEKKATLKRVFTAEKLERAQQTVTERREEKSKQAEQSKKEFENKVKSFTETQEMMEQYKRMSYHEKSVERDEKKKKSVEMRQLVSSSKKEESMNRNKRFQTSQERRLREEAEWKRMIIQKDEETNRIRQQLLEEKEVARNKKIDLTNEKKEKVSNRLRCDEIVQDFQNQRKLDRIDDSLARAKEQKKMLLEPDKEKSILSYLREEEIKESMERQERMRLYKGVKLEERIDGTLSKLSRTKSERKTLVDKKNEAIRAHNQRKAQIINEFERESVKMNESFREQVSSVRTRSPSLNRSPSAKTYKKDIDLYSSGRVYQSGSKSRRDAEGTEKKAPMSERVTIINSLHKKNVIKSPKKNRVDDRSSRPEVFKIDLEEARQDVEGQEAQIAFARRKNLKMFLGLLDLEMEDNLSNGAFIKVTKKVVRYAKGQDDELMNLMKSINYKNLGNEF